MIRTKSLLAAGMAIVALLASAQAIQSQEVRLEARLSGSTRASGQARFEQKGTRMKFNVELEDAAANTTYGVVVKRGTLIVYRGSISTNALRRGVIDIDNTEGDVVPRMLASDTVIVNLGTTRFLGGTLLPR